MDSPDTINTMIEMTTLFTGRPALGAPSEAVAGWYRAKGRMHARLAARGGADAAQESVYATASFEHARRLEEQVAAKAEQSAGWAA